jgi:hypothetical protein
MKELNLSDWFLIFVLVLWGIVYIAENLPY